MAHPPIWEFLALSGLDQVGRPSFSVLMRWNAHFRVETLISDYNLMTMGRWSGLRTDLWLTVAIAVGLMSGIASLVREWFSLFHPQAVKSGHLFDACVVTSFFVAVIIVFARQRSTITSLEAMVDANKEIQKRRVELGKYLTEGEQLVDEWRRGLREYGQWLQKGRDWVQRVSDFFVNIGFPDDAAAFRHGWESDPDINELRGPDQDVYWHKFYGSKIDRCRIKLAEIAARRLP